MKFKEFVRAYARAKALSPMPDTWVEEVERIVEGFTGDASAETRNVTRDAVKAQRKKIYKRLGVVNGKELLIGMFKEAVHRVPAPK